MLSINACDVKWIEVMEIKACKLFFFAQLIQIFIPFIAFKKDIVIYISISR